MKILIVEDEDTVRELLSEGLRSEGYEVLEADNGLDGLQMAKDLQLDLILLDLMLPEMDGMSVCRILRRTSDVPIIMLTARGTEMDKIVGLETGADDYIVKPFGIGELLARIRSVLRRTTSMDTDNLVLISSDIKMDINSRRVYKGNQELRLTNKEFNLLAELVRNKGAVLSRDLLLEKVWGYSYVGNTHTVDVHIRWLRKKIELDPSNPTRIITVRGVGYRFEE
ncbi:MAG TPA: DNA-binding response regulator [Chloroflexi bacterium]|nr:DNA-binding response regulator [Chloroflexota bacterium]|tara:strand:+ start:15586 stop:16260 length:675 start_codon:yes stop_codon:yes gene_type:complete